MPVTERRQCPYRRRLEFAQRNSWQAALGIASGMDIG
jgi:hypothetical protein